MQNWFDTLNQALESENLLDAWDMTQDPIQYGETRRWTWNNGTRYGHQISITREMDGRYERPVHYKRQQTWQNGRNAVNNMHARLGTIILFKAKKQ